MNFEISTLCSIAHFIIISNKLLFSQNFLSLLKYSTLYTSLSFHFPKRLFMNLQNNTFLILTISIIQILSTPKLTLAQSQFLDQWCGKTTYTPNSTYQSNLNTILHLISTNTQITNGFYNFSVGHRPDRVSSLALCRGDVPPTTCRRCLQDASNWLLLSNVCPNQKEAFGYSEYCSIFITNETISDQVQDQTPPWYVAIPGNVDNDVNNFNTTLYALMGELRNRAASGNSDLKYADGNMSLKGGQKIYGLVQCTPNLDKNNCMDCIDNNILVHLPTCCISRTIKASEAKFDHPSCFAQYALQPFFGVGNVPNVTLTAPQSSALIPNNSNSNITAGNRIFL